LQEVKTDLVLVFTKLLERKQVLVLVPAKC
jgi:hypothetical protein